MDVANWNWAVWVILAMHAFNFMLYASKHGQPKGDYDVKDCIIGTALGLWLLWCGGLFS